MSLNDVHQLRISSGTHRGKVKNTQVSWKRFCQKFAEPSVNQSITYAQYLAMSQDEQSKLKAAPGYVVGAQFEDGIRRLIHMKPRNLISFDLDEVLPRQMDEIELGTSDLSGYEFLRHTTRKHCPEKPRWRIHMPVSRPLDHEEANAVTRILAGQIFTDPQASIDAVDVVSHRFAQVSYLPSRSKDQEYRCERNEGEILDVDALLAAFPGDWKDHTQLPMRSNEKHARAANPHRKMEDPREKAGIIGAFCQVYDIEQAIAEFLPDVYVEGDTHDGHPRYSYAAGTSANGAVVYDDGLFITSHHGSDPIEGSANAWDMVRIHKFGHLDDAAREGTTPGKMPSFKAMAAMAGKITAVKIELTDRHRDRFDDSDDADDSGDVNEKPKTEHKGEAASKKTGSGTLADQFDDDEDEDEDEDEDPDGDPEGRDDADSFLDGDESAPKKGKKPKADKKWRAQLKANLETGAVAKSVHNVNLILFNDPGFVGTISYNRFSHKIVTRKPIDFPGLTLSRDPIPDPANGREWIDADEYDRKLVLAAPPELGGYDLDASVLDITAAVETAARNNSFHPVIEKLEKTTWDGVERAERLFIDYCGTPDNPYYRQIARAWLTAAVTRLYEPGHKFDFVPILGGRQGARKSTMIQTLGFGYFGELAASFEEHQKMVESMLGFWIMEIPELAGFRKNEVETIKQFFSAQWDRVRLAFRRNEETFQRQCVFMGSTNKEEYLKDETGNRRFWPVLVEVAEIDTDRLAREVPQLWAEVVCLYRAARKTQPKGYLPLGVLSPAAAFYAAELQDEARSAAPSEVMAETIEPWLNKAVSQEVADGSGKFDDDATDGEAKVRRIRVLQTDVWRHALGNERAANNVDLASLGDAVRRVEGWETVRAKISGVRARWIIRTGSAWRSDAWEHVDE